MQTVYYRYYCCTGDVAGKDVVEVYYKPPYTNGGIEKSSANLIEFAKTDLLQPGESQIVTVTFSIEDMASYDENNAKAYVLEKGDYVISINSDSHNVLDQKTYTADADVVYKGENKRASDDTAAINVFEDAKGDITYALAKFAVTEGAVLLKNEDGILPLKKNARIAVVGAMAKNLRYQGAGSSHINPTKLSQPIDFLSNKY